MNETDHKSKSLLSRSKYYLGLLLIVIIILVWHFSKIYLLKKRTETEKVVIINKYEKQLDSLNVYYLQLTAKTFSWALRSELLRGNKDQINQYFNEFIKTPGIKKLMLINPENSVIDISTDKKDVGTQNFDYINLKNQEIFINVNDFKIVTPISGMNNQIGIFIIEATNISNNVNVD